MKVSELRAMTGNVESPDQKNESGYWADNILELREDILHLTKFNLHQKICEKEIMDYLKILGHRLDQLAARVAALEP